MPGQTAYPGRSEPKGVVPKQLARARRVGSLSSLVDLTSAKLAIYVAEHAVQVGS